MTLEEDSSIERIYYECRLYGNDVYYGFAYYCFWRRVVENKNPDWLFCTPEYFLQELSK